MKKAKIWRRLKAFYIDAFLYEILITILFALLQYFGLKIDEPRIFLVIRFSLLFFLLIIRDITVWFSPGKKFYGLRVLPSTESNLPLMLRKLIRNIPIVIFPIDFVILMYSKRTIGDYISKTNVFDMRIKILKMKRI